jgi:[acyl-carrier-protein] S-malonyltransferase
MTTHLDHFKHFAMVFPGQGSQFIGMLSELAKNFPVVSEIFEQASDILRYNLWTLVKEGPEEKLNTTAFTQPAMLVADVACYGVWQKVTNNTLTPSYLAGHSLGEYSALVAAGVLDFADAVLLVQARGEYMQAACEPGVGAMAAVLAAEDSLILACCQEVTEANPGWVVQPANFNAIGQTVIAGHREAVEKTIEKLKEHGVKRAILLPVSVPSHCLLMQSAANKLALDFKTVNFSTPKIAVIHNVDVAMHSISTEIQNALLAQIYQPVQWVKTIEYLAQNQIDKIIEVGPGKTLSGLIKRINSTITAVPMDTPKLIDEAITLCK